MEYFGSKENIVNVSVSCECSSFSFYKKNERRILKGFNNSSGFVLFQSTCWMSKGKTQSPNIYLSLYDNTVVRKLGCSFRTQDLVANSSDPVLNVSLHNIPALDCLCERRYTCLKTSVRINADVCELRLFGSPRWSHFIRKRRRRRFF